MQFDLAEEYAKAKQLLDQDAYRFETRISIGSLVRL
jgi:hypothetical protein